MARPKGSVNREKETNTPQVTIAELAARPAGELTKKQLNAVKDYSEARKVVSEAQGKIDHFTALAKQAEIDRSDAEAKLKEISEKLF